MNKRNDSRAAKVDNNCIGCYYYKDIGRCNHQKCCHYMLITGELRGCDPANCDKKMEISPDDIVGLDRKYINDSVVKGWY